MTRKDMPRLAAWLFFLALCAISGYAISLVLKTNFLLGSFMVLLGIFINGIITMLGGPHEEKRDAMSNAEPAKATAGFRFTLSASNKLFLSAFATGLIFSSIMLANYAMQHSRMTTWQIFASTALMASAISGFSSMLTLRFIKRSWLAVFASALASAMLTAGLLVLFP